MEPVVVGMCAPHVVTMDPVVMVFRPMAGHPDHFIVSVPIARSVTVIRTVPYFDVNLRLRDSRENETYSQRGYEDQLVVFHTFTS